MNRKRAPPKVAPKKRARVGENTVEQNTLAGLEAPNHVGATAKLATGLGGMRRVAKEYTDDLDGDEDLRIVDDEVGVPPSRNSPTIARIPCKYFHLTRSLAPATIGTATQKTIATTLR